MNGFTDKEKEILDMTGDIWNKYVELEQQHPSDKPEFASAIHSLQHLMGMRILRREFPEIYPIIK